MENLKFYEVNPEYIDYLIPIAPHLFRNKKPGQNNERKYIGVVLNINEFEYFVPLSSFKAKHKKMKEGLDFIKIKNYAVINLNNMFPVPSSERRYVNISEVENFQYKNLLLSEYRYIKAIQEKICKNAKTLYYLKLKDGNSTSLAKRCNDFSSLEIAYTTYSSK